MLLIQGMFTIALSSDPSLPIFLRRCKHCKLWC